MKILIVASLTIIGLFVGTFFGVLFHVEEVASWAGLIAGFVGGLLLARQTPRGPSARRDRAEQRIRDFREQYPNQAIRRRDEEN